MKELVIFDIDGTIVKGQSQRLFLKYLLSVHKISRLFYVKLLSWFVLYKLGLVKDPRKVMEYAFSFLKGESVEATTRLAHDFFERKLKDYIYPDAADLIKEHQNAGREVMLVSNAAEPIVEEIAAHFDIEHYVCTTLEIKDGYYTGRIEDIIYGDRKTDRVERFAEDHDRDLKTAWAYGDHASDQSLLSAVGHPVAVNPSSVLHRIARQRHWQVLAWR